MSTQEMAVSSLRLVRGLAGSVLALVWAALAVAFLATAGGLVAYDFIGVVAAAVVAALLVQPSLEVIATTLAMPGKDRAARVLVIAGTPPVVWWAVQGRSPGWTWAAGLAVVVWAAPRARRRARLFRARPAALTWRLRTLGGVSVVGGSVAALFVEGRLPASWPAVPIVGAVVGLAVAGALVVVSHELLGQLAPEVAVVEDGEDAAGARMRAGAHRTAQRVRVALREFAQV